MNSCPAYCQVHGHIHPWLWLTILECKHCYLFFPCFLIFLWFRTSSSWLWNQLHMERHPARRALWYTLTPLKKLKIKKAFTNHRKTPTGQLCLFHGFTWLFSYRTRTYLWYCNMSKAFVRIDCWAFLSTTMTDWKRGRVHGNDNFTFYRTETIFLYDILIKDFQSRCLKLGKQLKSQATKYPNITGLYLRLLRNPTFARFGFWSASSSYLAFCCVPGHLEGKMKNHCSRRNFILSL